MKNGKVFLNRIYAAHPIKDHGPVVLDLQRNGDELIVNGTGTTVDGKTYTWKDVAKRIE